MGADLWFGGQGFMVLTRYNDIRGWRTHTHDKTLKRVAQGQTEWQLPTNSVSDKWVLGGEASQ